MCCGVQFLDCRHAFKYLKILMMDSTFATIWFQNLCVLNRPLIPGPANCKIIYPIHCATVPYILLCNIELTCHFLLSTHLISGTSPGTSTATPTSWGTSLPNFPPPPSMGAPGMGGMLPNMFPSMMPPFMMPFGKLKSGSIIRKKLIAIAHFLFISYTSYVF